MKHQPITAARDPLTGARYLPPVMFFVVVEFDQPTGSVIGFAGDPVPDLDTAADQVGEVMKDPSDRVVAVLRLSDTLNCDDVTADAYDTLRLRMVQRHDADGLQDFDAWVEDMADRAKPPRDWAPSDRFGAIRDYPEFDSARLTWADIGLIGCASLAGAGLIYAVALVALALLP